jgi:hypothetical protein
MPTDPFERNDRQDKIARRISQGANIIWSVGLAGLGIVLIALGLGGVGGALPIVLGVLALLAAGYNLLRPFRL